MAGGKTSPRQKMINMMYFVLLALLAMNVSKEILKAFHLMEVSFENAKLNIDDKNNLIMKQFEASMETHPARTKPWLDKAIEVRKVASEFNAYIDSVKSFLEKEAGGRKALAEGETGGKLTELSAPDNMEKHANYFDEGSGKQGQGKVLQAAIEKAREDMLKVLDDPKLKSERDNISKNTALRADDPEGKGPNKQTWATMYLTHSPLGGVAAILSKIQSDAKNLEADVLNLLVQQINASTIKFDAVEAKLIAPSSYIMAGSTYEAEIVLMAINTTAQPKIVVNGQEIPVVGGKGIYKVQAPSSAGIQKVEGYVEVEGPDGLQKVNFTPAEWQSFQPAATISAEAMNVLYIGLENPISVSVPGFRADDVTVSMTAGSGTLTKTTGTGKYIAKVQRVQGSKTKITASVRMPDGTSRQMGQMEYRIREVPNPEPLYGSLTSGAHGKAALMAQQTLNASLGAGFAFEGVKFVVTKYAALLVPRSGQARMVPVNGNSLQQVNGLVSGARAGDKIIIAEVEARGPGGITKKLTANLLIDIR